MTNFLLNKDFTKNELKKGINCPLYPFDGNWLQKIDYITDEKYDQDVDFEALATCINDEEVSEICRQLYYVDPDIFGIDYTPNGQIKRKAVKSFLEDYLPTPTYEGVDYVYRVVRYKKEDRPIAKKCPIDPHLAVKEAAIAQAVILGVLTLIMKPLHELEAVAKQKQNGAPIKIILTDKSITDNYIYG